MLMIALITPSPTYMRWRYKVKNLMGNSCLLFNPLVEYPQGRVPFTCFNLKERIIQ